MDAANLIDRLNEDLAGELGAVVQYLTYAAKVSGPYRPQLQQFFASEIPEELAHASFLADKIVALGGEPTTTARPVPEAKTNRAMLERVLEAEKRAISDYTTRAEQAEAAGEKGLQVRLEDIVAEETTHFEQTKRILESWPLD